MRSVLAPGQIVARAGTMLRVVRLGLRDIDDADQDRALFGFLGVVVFGRSMTLVMQNLRTHDANAFDTWYAPWQKEMKDDPLMRYFSELRTNVIHKDSPPISIVFFGFGETAPPVGTLTVEGPQLPDRHLGQPITDSSMRNLCRLYVEYLRRMFDAFAPVAFAVQDRVIGRQGKPPNLEQADAG